MSPSTTHVPWGSIELLHNLVQTLGHLNGLGQPFPLVEYRAKVKLHGTNCAVQITGDGVVAQSRTALLSPEADYKGFAAWVGAHRGYFAALEPGLAAPARSAGSRLPEKTTVAHRACGAERLVVFGEWCGPGIEKGMAISRASTKMFAVFAIRRGTAIVHDPDGIRALLPIANAPGELHVLPWEGPPITIAFGDREGLSQVASELNARVALVEREDPWVKQALGISGLGEGLVFYPVRVDGAAPETERFEQLMFKAKGEKHRTAGTRTAVQIDPSVVASVADFVSLMVTDARLEQGLSEACGGARDPRGTRQFLAWVVADVRKESTAELAASGLSWEDVDKAVQTRAREWFRMPEQAS